MDVAPATMENSANDRVSPPSEKPPAQPDVNGGSGGVGGEVVEGGGSIGGGFTEDVDRNSGGNRWPKQETLALIRIRSDMDAAFRDSNLKAPLWDEVSRKLSELGFHRSAKKCREKFENVYKYHRRTKEGRSCKSDKIYRFSDQLQALESNHGRGSYSPLTMKPPPGFVPKSNTCSTVPSPYNITSPDQNNASPISVAAPSVAAIPPARALVNHKRSFPFSQATMSGSTNSGSWSDTDEPPRKKGRWEAFFEKLVKELMEKQQQLQVKFLETLDRRESDRVAKEEAWRAQEIAKLNQEHDRLVKERSMLAAKDAAIVAFLHNLIGKNLPVVDDGAREKITAIPQPQTHQTAPPAVQQPSVQRHREVLPPPAAKINPDGVEENALSPSPSRWPKAEINALITLRSQLDAKYQENVPKGPLWEEISAAMRNLGYNRNAKRCKEKWENINKYYKKIKESNKKRPEDSKTCPYYDQLDALYSTKTTPIIAQPEQQWPPATALIEQPPPQQQQPPSDPGQQPQPPSSSVHMEDQGSEDFDDFDDDHGNHDGDGDGDGDDEDKEDERGVYEFVASKISSMAAV